MCNLKLVIVNPVELVPPEFKLEGFNQVKITEFLVQDEITGGDISIGFIPETIEIESEFFPFPL